MNTTPLLDPNELPIRYVVARGMVGVPSLPLLGRTLWGVAAWMLVPSQIARSLGWHGLHRSQHAVERWWARRVTQHLQIKLQIEGLEHIAPRQTYVVAPLHEGFADALALFQLPLPLRFVARDELFRWRWLGPLLRDMGQIEVTPEQGTRAYRTILRAAPAVFARGESLLIFPQGTILGIESDFNVGAFAVARALEQPLLPVALTGGHRVWEHPYTPRLRYGQRMSMRVLPPVKINRTDDLDAVRVHVRRQLKAAALDGSMAPPRRFVPQRDGYWDGYRYAIDPDFAELAAYIAQHRAAIMNRQKHQEA
jgi:1-acyl-sn-glycerol-3-phosphate acyltransferase